MHKGRTEMRDWYNYHEMCARELKQKAENEALTLLEKTLLNEHEYWIKELELQIETGTDDGQS